MVTTTNENDDLPTHDCFGTDLRRVRAMLDLGYRESAIAQALGITTNHARHAVIVATDDRQGSPTLQEIADRCREIQDGWTVEQAQAARRHEPRTSSTAVRPDAAKTAAATREKVARYWARRQEWRVHHGPIPVIHYPAFASELRFRASVQLAGKNASRFFATREEAEAWGRDWLVKRYEALQAEACCGS